MTELIWYHRKPGWLSLFYHKKYKIANQEPLRLERREDGLGLKLGGRFLKKACVLFAIGIVFYHQRCFLRGFT